MFLLLQLGHKILFSLAIRIVVRLFLAMHFKGLLLHEIRYIIL